MNRSLGLTKAANARDLGGYPLADGRRIHTGVLFRSAALHRLTPADVATVARLNLACLIDFRHPHEIDYTGPDRLPVPPPARLVALPLLDPEHDVFTVISSMLTGQAGVDRVAMLRDGGAEVAMVQLYRWLVSSTMARGVFAAALRTIAAAEALPVLFHCTAGKDRTGWLSVLLLTILGVAQPIIIDDYLRTNELNAADGERVRAILGGQIDDPTLIQPLLDARPAYLEAAMAEVATVFGDMPGYLRHGLGLDDSVLDALRATLITES